MSKYQYILADHPVEHGVSVNVDSLKIDPNAQRALSEKRAQAIVDEFVPEAVGSIVVSERKNGKRYIVDGMHRHRDIQLRGEKTIVAEIHKGLTQKEEAMLFLIKNRETKGPSAFDEYRIGLTAKLPLFADTQRALDAHGLTVGSTSTNTVGAVNGILRITNTYGAEILDRTLRVAEKAWGRSPATWDGMLLGGIGQFLGRHGDIVDDEELASKMAKAGPAQAWIGKVCSLATAGGMHHSGTGSRVATCYTLLLAHWNRGKTKNKIAA